MKKEGVPPQTGECGGVVQNETENFHMELIL